MEMNSCRVGWGQQDGWKRWVINDTNISVSIFSLSFVFPQLAMKRVRELLDLDPDEQAQKNGTNEVMWACISAFIK